MKFNRKISNFGKFESSLREGIQSLSQVTKKFRNQKNIEYEHNAYNFYLTHKATKLLIYMISQKFWDVTKETSLTSEKFLLAYENYLRDSLKAFYFSDEKNDSENNQSVSDVLKIHQTSPNKDEFETFGIPVAISDLTAIELLFRAACSNLNFSMLTFEELIQISVADKHFTLKFY